MQGQVTKWGNSLALRLPKSIAADVRLHEGSQVDMRVEGDSLVVRPSRPKYKLKDLLVHETPTRSEEFDWGKAQGEEEW
jgi:antitoxin MazE